MSAPPPGPPRPTRLLWNRQLGRDSTGRALEVRCQGTTWTAQLPEGVDVMAAVVDFQRLYHELHGMDCPQVMGVLYVDGRRGGTHVGT